MSRHSKNNTAHSVFTYAEKQKLKGEYGTTKIRLGQDSQRNFEMCHLCLQTVKNPLTCDKGHIFCKECIMLNLLTQKKNIKKAQIAYEKRSNNDQFRQLLKKREIEESKVRNFSDDMNALGTLKKLKVYKKKYEVQTTMTEEDRKKLKDKHDILTDKRNDTFSFDNGEMKSRLIQNSFWVAEANQSRVLALKNAKDANPEKKPSGKMICPGDNRHKIKTKTIYPLVFKNGFNCFSCANKLGFQKIVALKTCSHVHCKDCLKDFCIKTMTCTCGKKFLSGDCIKMEEGKSSFAQHNKVEASNYRAAF